MPTSPTTPITPIPTSPTNPITPIPTSPTTPITPIPTSPITPITPVPTSPTTPTTTPTTASTTISLLFDFTETSPKPKESASATKSTTIRPNDLQNIRSNSVQQQVQQFNSIASPPPRTPRSPAPAVSQGQETPLQKLKKEVIRLTEKIIFGNAYNIPYARIMEELEKIITGEKISLIDIVSMGYSLRKAIVRIEDKAKEFFDDRVIDKEELSGCTGASRFKSFTSIKGKIFGYVDEFQDGYILETQKIGYHDIYAKLRSPKMYKRGGDGYRIVEIEAKNPRIVYLGKEHAALEILDSCTTDKGTDVNCHYDIVDKSLKIPLNFQLNHKCTYNGCTYERLDGTFFTGAVMNKQQFLKRFGSFGQFFTGIMRSIIENQYLPIFTVLTGVYMLLQLSLLILRCAGVKNKNLTIKKVKRKVFDSRRRQKKRDLKRLRKLYKELKRKEKKYEKKYGSKRSVNFIGVESISLQEMPRRNSYALA